MAVKALRSWVRAVDGRDAAALLRLHRELWFDHDGRGGMPASTDEQVWLAYGEMLERQLSHRDGRRAPNGAFEGKLGHLVAEWDGRVVGQLEDSPTWPDVIDGTDSDEAWTATAIRDGAGKLAAVMETGTTSDRTYWFGPVSVAALFGGRMPKQFVVWVAHNSGVNLNATGGNHALWITPVYETVA